MSRPVTPWVAIVVLSAVAGMIVVLAVFGSWDAPAAPAASVRLLTPPRQDWADALVARCRREAGIQDHMTTTNSRVFTACLDRETAKLQPR